MVQAQMTRIDTRLGTERRNITESEGWLMEELHDGVTQSLWYLGVELSALKQEISSADTGLQAQVASLGLVAQEAYNQLRAILNDAWKPNQSDQILNEAVQNEVKSFEVRTGICVELSMDVVRWQVPSWQSYHVATILREALSNAWKHGNSDEVWVGLEVGEGIGTLTVLDRGVGFDPTDLREGHYGLGTMQKRAKALGGEVEIRSNPGFGTRVQLTFPMWK